MNMNTSRFLVLLEIRERNCSRKTLLIVVYDQEFKDIIAEFNSFGDVKQVETAAMQFLSKYEPNFCIITEAQTALPASFSQEWQNRRIVLSKLFQDVTGETGMGLPDMLKYFGLLPELDYHIHKINLCRDMAEVVHALHIRFHRYAFIAKKMLGSGAY